MNRKIINLLCAFAVILLLSGCSLAAEDGGGTQSKDQLIGALITRDYIEKTYAEIRWNEDRNQIEGLHFEGIDGHYSIYSFYDYNGEPVFYTQASEGLDYSTRYKVADASETVEMNIKAYVVPEEREDNMYYLNPVYKDKENRIYIVAGNSASAALTDGVGSVGMSLKETEKISGVKDLKELTVEIPVEFSYMETPEKIRFLQMNKEHKEIKMDEYEAGQVPEFFVTEEETEYVVVISDAVAEDGERVSKREVCSYDGGTIYTADSDKKEEQLYDGRPASLHQTFYANGSGFLLKQSTWFIWNE